MSPALIGICALLYVWTAILFVVKGQFAWAVVFAAYALANVGLILASV